MDTIDQYFQEEYISEKNSIKEIEILVNDVIKTFSLKKEIKSSNNESTSKIFGWPYELIDRKSLEVNTFSYSTNSMILFVLKKLFNIIEPNSPIIPYIVWETNWGNVKRTTKQENQKNKKTKKFYEEYYNKVKTSLIENFIPAPDTNLIFSSSFGKDDPFTLSWIAELIAKDLNGFSTIKDKFVKICIDKIAETFEEPNKNILDFSDNESKRESSNHIFPLLRLIHLYKTLSNNNFFDCDLNEHNSNLDRINDLIHTKLYDNLQNRINQQISYSILQNSFFDTAELVLSIEGLVLIDDKRRLDETLFTKAFEILKNNQKNNLYWRPLKPFVSSPQGDILLPLSIEIANSLLRICKHLKIKKKYYFHEFFDIFENYTKWLLSNVSQCRIGDEEYRGWRSEHVQKLNVIHPWETAQVVIYLMNYKSMIQDHIAYKALKKSGLSCDHKYVKDGKDISTNFWENKWDVNADLGFLNCYKDIKDKFITERINANGNPQYSMLLYGPPGTGKSSIAEDLAQSLNWRLITITPSDFIKHGEADIEGRAKNIFKTLEEQKDCVILFDEIDRLILDRDSNYYSNQGDFYQFMTPSMLVKIKDLRTKKRSIFIIATNYEERIDSAIKRSGRIDEKYLVNVPNLKQRQEIIEKLIHEKGGSGISFNDLYLISIKTVFYTYGELKILVKNAWRSLNGNYNKENVITELTNSYNRQDQPTIKLSNYKRRFQTEKLFENGKEVSKDLPIFPYREFLTLVFLKLETGVDLSPDERKLLTRVYKTDPEFKLENYFQKDSKIFKKLEPIIKPIEKEGND